jgi:glycolate oxidase FAD binding subunit
MAVLHQYTPPPEPRVSWRELDSLLGPGRVLPASPSDAIDGVVPARVAEPASQAELAQALGWANANGVPVAPRGGGTKLGWGNLPAALALVLSTRCLGTVIEHAAADMTMTVEAGCTIERLQQVAASQGQRLALDPLWPERATVGGVIATNDSGALRLRFGSIRDLIIGATLALADGTLAKSGGKVVKNVAGYDLSKLATGSLGTLGIVTQAVFRLHPLPRVVRTVTFTCAHMRAANNMLLAILDSKLVPSGIQLRVESESRPQLDVRFEGIRAGIEAQERELFGIGCDAPNEESPPDVWRAREDLWSGSPTFLICKLSVLPSELNRAAEHVAALCAPGRLRWKFVGQGTGLALVRMEGEDSVALLSAFRQLRSQVHLIGGTVVLLESPLQLKQQVDVWGDGGDSRLLMVRVKQQFDPAGILNRGRLVGGI